VFFLQDAPVWVLALVVFVLRVCDVSMGTLRTLTIVQGRTALAITLGFFEVLLWILAVSQVISEVKDEPVLAVAYAGGFACGNGVGMWLEKRLAIGSVVVRLFSARSGDEIARLVRAQGLACTTFAGEGRDGAVTLLYVACSRSDATRVIDIATEVDPAVFYIVERSSAGTHGRPQAPRAHSWQQMLKRRQGQGGGGL
jgi:uncharacterized protein YebE (UPF0316 family)